MSERTHECGAAGDVLICQHAIQRYMERSGQQCPRRAESTIAKWLRRAHPIDERGVMWYGGGWIFPVREGRVTTAMRPTKELVILAVKQSMNPTKPQP